MSISDFFSALTEADNTFNSTDTNVDGTPMLDSCMDVCGNSYGSTDMDSFDF